MANLELFIGALIAVYVVPGPDMVLVLQTSSGQGRRHAIAISAGLALARAAHVVLAAVGLAVLLKNVSWAFELVRLIGVAYLIFLGIKIARAPSLAPNISATSHVKSKQTYRAAACRGLITNISNPKALLFCSILLPQFVDPQAGNVAAQFFILGIVLVSMGMIFDFLYAMAGIALGNWIDRYPVIETAQRWTFATLLIGFGLRLAVTEHPK